jgi:hypothetical protein
VRGEWLDSLSDGMWRFRNSHHQRHVWAVYIRIEQTDFVTEFDQADSEVDSNRAFPNSSFPGSNCNDVLNPGDW